MSTPAPLRMFIDFDGTLVEPNVAIRLVEEFCADGPRVANEIDILLHEGKITLREAWGRQVELMRADQIPAMVDWSVRNVPLRAGARELLALLKRYEVPTSIVSGGLDFYIHPILKHAGIELPVFCDSVRTMNGGTLEVLHPYGHATCRLCGICKAQLVHNVDHGPIRTVFAGDGSTDRYGAEVADIVFARRRLRAYCEGANIPYVPFDTFEPVTDQLERWLSGTEPMPALRRVGLSTSACPISVAAAAWPLASA